MNNYSALLCQSWVPETSTTFHYWQPALDGDRSRGCQILATQPFSPHAERKNGTWKREGREGVNRGYYMAARYEISL